MVRGQAEKRSRLLHPDAGVDAALARIRGRSPIHRPNVRRLAQFASLHKCPTAAVSFAAGVDTNRLFAGTSLQMPFGQSSFAIARGISFEKHLRRNNYAQLRAALTDGYSIDFSNARIEDLRHGFPKNSIGMAQRASATRDLLVDIVRRGVAPVVLDGAVLAGDVGGVPSFFEADEIGIGIGGDLCVGEEKSWPVVDGRAVDEDALGAALDQEATYVLLGRRTLESAGLDPSRFSSDAALINPRNTGLTPVLHHHNVEGRVRRIERLLNAVPSVSDIAASVPASVTFDRVADESLSEEQRFDAFASVGDALGVEYEPGVCLSTCGLAAACRRRAFSRGDAALAGSRSSRALPGIADLGRAAELSHGAVPNGAEVAAAHLIARAGALYDAATSESTASRAGAQV